MHTDMRVVDPEELLDCPIIVAEDEDTVRALLTRLLEREGYTAVHPVAQAGEVVPAIARVRADLVLLDLHMADESGFDVITRVHADMPTHERPQIIVLTGDHTQEARHRALAGGAADFLTKPLDHFEVLLRVRNLLRMHALTVALHQQNERLEQKVRERTAELDRSELEILQRLALAAEHRDNATGQHTRRVADLSARLATSLGLSEQEAELIRRAALLHDVGKIALSDAILLKQGPLTADERTLMQRHTTLGAAILADSAARVLQVAEQIALCHHEWWDGSGYPAGLRGDDIPLAARIVSVADAFDALTHERPYKHAWRADDAVRELQANSGSQFDPQIVGVMVTLYGAG